MSLALRDRVKELRRVPADQLLANPKNWRTHPESQLQALRGLMQQIGFAGATLARELPDGSLMLIDGHARKDIAGSETVSVLVTDLTEEEADLLLATYDPVSTLAGADQQKLAALLDEVSVDGPLKAMLDDLAGKTPAEEVKPVPIDLTPAFAVMVKVPDEATQRQLMEQADAAGFENSAIVTGLAQPRKIETTPPPAEGVVRIVRETPIQRTPRVRQVEGMFDLPPSETIRREWDYKLDLPEQWKLGLIVGPSGSGKTSLAREWFGDKVIESWPWPADQAILDGFPAEMPIHEVTGLLSSVGFSSPPGWTKPYHVLSNGEKFRVDVARTLAEMPDLAVIDEFTSVVDRTVAKIGSAAVAKAVRQSGRRLVAASCHYDIAEWLCPDWMLDCETGTLTRRSLQRPPVALTVRRADTSAWRIFREHHYLSHDLHKAAACFVAKVDRRPAAFLAVIHSPHPTHARWRASRIVCLPDFQGIGLGSRLTDLIAAAYTATGKEFSVVTSHPAMIASLARSPNWRAARSYTRPGMQEGLPSLRPEDLRLTCSFIFNGEPNPDHAQALGILKA